MEEGNPMMVSAYIDRQAKYNLITRALAERLSLDIAQSTSTAFGVYRSAVIQSVGTTTIYWNDIEFKCVVCETLGKPLVFGQPFANDYMLRRQAMTQQEPGQRGDRT